MVIFGYFHDFKEFMGILKLCSVEKNNRKVAQSGRKAVFK